jgi:Zn ribbon nucleic-acid-binding protein
MQQVIDIPECDFCHSIDLILFYDKPSGLIVQCAECGYSRVPANVHLSSDSITLLAG